MLKYEHESGMLHGKHNWYCNALLMRLPLVLLVRIQPVEHTAFVLDFWPIAQLVVATDC